MKCCSSNLHELKPALLMVLVQTVYSLVNICYKLAANDGMNLSVLVGYRFMFSAAFILPLAIFAERKKRPKLTPKIALYGFLCGLFGGSLGQNLYAKGLVLTSATFSSAMTNLIPAITFIVAITLRLERLAWNSAAGKAKVFGTMLGIGGAMVITFYKGVELHPWNTNINLLETTSTHHHHSLLEPHHQHSVHRYVLGAVLSLASCLCYSIWLIIQAKAAELYPCPYSITAMMALAASFQGIAFALCVERDWSQWNMGWDIRLFTVSFSGIFGSGLVFALVAWCVRTRGPLFVSIFQPLMLVMVGLGGSLFLEEKLHLGMVIGAIFIVGGLYIVLWGKRKEFRTTEATTENTANEERIDIPPSSPPPQHNVSSHSRRGSRAQQEVEVEVVEEEQAHIDTPPSQSGSRVEAEVEGRIDMLLPLPLPRQNDTIHTSSSGGVEEQAEVESQNSSHSCSGRSRVEEGRGRIDLPPPSQAQNDNIHSSSGRKEVAVEIEAETRMSMSSHSENGTSLSSSDSIKEVEVEVEVKVDEREEEKKDPSPESRDNGRLPLANDGMSVPKSNDGRIIRRYSF